MGVIVVFKAGFRVVIGMVRPPSQVLLRAAPAAVACVPVCTCWRVLLACLLCFAGAHTRTQAAATSDAHLIKQARPAWLDPAQTSHSGTLVPRALGTRSEKSKARSTTLNSIFQLTRQAEAHDRGIGAGLAGHGHATGPQNSHTLWHTIYLAHSPRTQSA